MAGDAIFDSISGFAEPGGENPSLLSRAVGSELILNTGLLESNSLDIQECEST